MKVIQTMTMFEQSITATTTTKIFACTIRQELSSACSTRVSRSRRAARCSRSAAGAAPKRFGNTVAGAQPGWFTRAMIAASDILPKLIAGKRIAAPTASVIAADTEAGAPTGRESHR